MVSRISRKIVFLVSIIIILLFTFHKNLYGKEFKNPGYKYYKNYTYLEYDHHPQNWCILQDKKGLIYIGNLAGVLIYDGREWNIIEIPNMLVRSMDIGKDGYIYLGGKDEFGYLAPNSKGTIEYISLKKYFNPHYGDISDVFDTISLEEGVYFRSRNLLFRWNYKNIDIYMEGIFKSLFFLNNTLYIQQLGTGLQKIEKGSFTPLPGGKFFGKTKIRMMVPYKLENNSWSFLIGMGNEELLIYNNGTISPFETEANVYLQKNVISHGIRLSANQFAISTLNGGLVIIDPHGKIKYIFNKTNGLQDNNVKYIFEDFQSCIWLALSRGISKLEYQSPFCHYDESSGLEGMAFTVVKHKKNLYTGTAQGIYVLYPNATHFQHIVNIPTCWELLSTENALFAATQDGVYQLDTIDGKLQQLFNINTFQMAISKKFPNHIWCASKSGLCVIGKINGRWSIEKIYKELYIDIRNVIEDPGGYLWLVASEGDIIKVEFPNDITQPVITRFNQKNRLHEEELFMAIIEEHVVFASRKGLFHYDKNKENFVPDMTLGAKYAYGPKAKPIFRITQDINRNIWFHSESRNYRAVPVKGGAFEILDGPLRRIPLIQVNSIYSESDGNLVWYAGLEGITQFNHTVKTQWDINYTALVRSVIVNEKTPIYEGRGQKNNDNSNFSFPYEDRNFIFKCAASFFEREKDIIFRYNLEGFSKNWSEWTSESQKHFTNLDAKNYIFRVQAKNIYGVISKEDSFSFKILPPWYRTLWGIMLFTFILLIAFLLLLNLIVKKRSRKLVKENERLEQVVIERTKEVREKNNQLEQQTFQLQKQSKRLKEMDEIKSRFFANISHGFRTPLTLIMSPLEQMLSNVQDKTQKKKYRLMLRNSQQLLTLINQLLSLSKLDSGKMKLQASHQNIFPLLETAVTAFHDPCEQKQITLDFISKIQPKKSRHNQLYPPILLYFDYDKMEEVIYNLLSNAFKFTPPGGKITLSISIQSQNICISVYDTGKGIPKDQLDYIFDRFYQAGNGTSMTVQGTGIGLALVKEIVTLHRGEIEVNSQEGKGTEFVVKIPMGKNHLTDGQIVSNLLNATKNNRGKEVIAACIQSEIVSNEKQEHNENNNAISITDKGISSEKVTILVVEDHNDMREHIHSLLDEKFNILEAVNGKEGISIAKESIPDLVVSDIMMPDVDGYQLCRELKKDIKTSHIPIILLTAKTSEKSIIKGLETGADDYVTKPFNSDILLTRIQNLIDIRQQMQRKIQREKMLLPSEIHVSNQDDLFLKDFQAIIEKELANENFNIDTICKKLLISRAALFKKIQALTGETPNQFIQSYRLERAAQLLKNNYGNVTEVAMAVGFSSSQYFAKCFKEKFHLTPKAYHVSESPNT